MVLRVVFDEVMIIFLGIALSVRETGFYSARHVAGVMRTVSLPA